MDILTLLYSFSGLVLGTAYIPQISTLIKDRSGAISLSLSSWLIFSTCSTIGLFYACMHNKDAYFIFGNVINVVGNYTVLGLGVMRRLQTKLIANPVFAS